MITSKPTTAIAFNEFIWKIFGLLEKKYTPNNIISRINKTKPITEKYENE
jgi:hypothetical protein